MKLGERSVMAQPIFGENQVYLVRLMIDSRTTSHINSMSNKVMQKVPCDVSIAVAVGSTTRASHQGVRKVSFHGDECEWKVTLSGPLLVPDVAMSLLSILVRNKIGLL